jgi:hypothetical protein
MPLANGSALIQEAKARLVAFDVSCTVTGGKICQGITAVDCTFEENDHLNHALVELNEQQSTSWHEKEMQRLLYSTEVLRKRAGEDREGA